jgi:predicted nucleotidyltransferase
MKLPNKLQNAWYSSILEEITQLFFVDKRIHAFWVEGSIAQGRSDEYSDLDLWVSIDNDSETEIFAMVEKLLRSHGKLDINYVMATSHPEIFHTVYHIEGKNEFQTIELNLQHKSRVITLDEDVDDYLIIFDKAEIVKSLITKPKDIDWAVTMERVRQYYFLMHPNVIKNIKRGRPLEAKIYYDYLVQYLVKTIRKLHTPNKVDYGLKHSYHDLPKEYLDFLQDIAFVKNEEEMLEGLDKMKQFIEKFELKVSVPETN